MGSRSLVIMDGIPGRGSQRGGIASTTSTIDRHCRSGGSRELWLPPLRRQGVRRRQGKSSRLKPRLQMPGRDYEPQVLGRLAIAEARRVGEECVIRLKLGGG